MTWASTVLRNNRLAASLVNTANDGRARKVTTHKQQFGNVIVNGGFGGCPPVLLRPSPEEATRGVTSLQATNVV